MITLHIDTRICKGCGLCIYYCPREVIVLSNQHNDKGFAVAEVSAPERCTGCRLCEMGCPDLAVYVEKDQL